MRLDELRPGLLVADGRSLLKVSTVYASRATLQLVYPKPPRTTVRTYTSEQVWLHLSNPGPTLLAEYERAYQRR